MKAWRSFDSWESSLLERDPGIGAGYIGRVFAVVIGNRFAVVAEEIDPHGFGVEVDRHRPRFLVGTNGR